MPVPPILIAPVPNEPIASQAWGVPVTNAINALGNGHIPCGCMLLNEAANQGIDNTLETVAFNASDVLWDSDGFFDDATDQWTIKPGLAGVYEVLFHASCGTFPNDASYRLQIQKNGSAIGQFNAKIGYNSSAIGLIHGFWRLADNDVIRFQASASAAVTMSRKALRLTRIMG